MKWAVFDIETDGLNPTKIHCLSFQCEDGAFSLTDYDDMRRFFEAYDVYIGHNITLFDLPVCRRLLGADVYQKKVVDTLALSWYLYPERTASHGLEAWGDELGVSKVVISDWDNLSIDDYIKRCSTDVDINVRLWERQLTYLNKLYKDGKTFWKFLKYLHFKMDCVREQEEEKWKLDVDFCKESISRLESIKADKLRELSAAMPKVPIISVRSRPKVLRKQDGTYSSHGLKWLELLRRHELPEEYDGTIDVVTGFEEPNPTSHPQIKAWLYGLGWVPSAFKTNPKGKEVPQINNSFTGELNPCVRSLYDKAPAIEFLNSLFCINHRLGILKGFLRDQEGGYLKASISGFTNTLRFKHSEIVNLPKTNKPYGEYARGCLVAPDGYVLCGADMASLEDRIKQHYIYPLDPEYVETMLGEGFDPHLDLAVLGKGLTQEQADAYKAGDKQYKSIRDIFKNGNYACQYGAGAAKLVKTCNISLEQAKDLHKVYWSRNWAVKEVASQQEIVTVEEQDWLMNPVSGFYYSLRSRKDVFSTLVQGTASYVFDVWVGYLRAEGVLLTGQFHDEKISKHPEGTEAETERIHFEAIELTNEVLKLNRRLDIDVKFNTRYSEIH